MIITSDHGELFGEHGIYRHRHPMYEGLVKVPLLIKFPFSINVGREKGMITLVMEKRLRNWIKEHGPKFTDANKKGEAVSDEVLQGLKALGYIQ